MKRSTAGFLALGLMMIGVAIGQKKSDADALMEAARQKEVVEGDLHGAIKQYGVIVAKFKTDRAVAAMALVRMAECHQKVGDAEARKIFEQVVRDYGDQKEAVAMARAKLGGSGQPGRLLNAMVWSGPDVDAEGTVSADGRYLSYTDWSTGDLAVRELATGNNRKVTNTGNGKDTSWSHFAEESAISRDGKLVAFNWFDSPTKRYDLRIANLTGEPNPRRLYDDPGNEWLAPRDWSPDGRWIAVMISRKDQSDRLALVSVTDGSLRILKTGNWHGDTRIFFSPDGKYLGYDLPENEMTSQPRDLYVFAISEGREIPVAVRRGQDLMMGWAPDGRHLLFASDRTGSLALWAMPFHDGKIQGSPEMVKSEIGAVESVGVTQSGAFYYGLTNGSVASSAHVAAFDFETGRISSDQNVSEDYLESNGAPMWSPDGRQYIYNSSRGAGFRVVSKYVIRATDTNQVVRELPTRLLPNGYTPDGRSLLNCCWFEGKQGAFRTDLVTNQISTVFLETADTDVSQFRNPVLSRDGKTLFFSRAYSPHRKEYAIFRRDLASGVEKELIRRPSFGGINLSPDEKYITTPSVNVSSNSRVLLLFPAAGGEVKEVMAVPSGVAPADLKDYGKGAVIWNSFWRPDSSAFLLRVRRAPDAQTEEHWRVPLSGSPQKLDVPLDGKIGPMRISPDGSRVAYVVNEAASVPRRHEIWVLENFLPVDAKK